MSYLLFYLIAINVIAFAAMGIDKAKARAGKWRIAESTLFALAALGGALGGLVDALSPVLIGFAVAYLLFPVCDFFEKKVCGFIEKKKPRPRLRRIAAVVLTLLAATAFLVFFVWMLVPQIKASYLNLEATFDTYLEKASVYLGEVTAKYTEPGTEPVFDSAALLDTVGGWIDSLFDQVGNFMSSAVSYSSKLLNTIWRIIFSLIFMVVFLVEKDAIGARLNSIASTLLTRRGKAFCDKWVRYTDESFGGFISGKILDAVIITLINFIVFGLAGIPYYPLVSLVCGVTDVIPYFGPFIGAVPCAFIILIADPIKMIWFIVLTLVIQQCDGNIIGPKILGEKVGVDSLMIVVAITVSGGLWGLVGMFIGVPLFAVLRQAVKELVESRLQKKHLPTETTAYMDKQREAAE